ncbi:1-acylglycerol-3-phosphate O-acyltransferase ABHD5-like isoform X2 [Uloborus diversus]|uniref:1-acylglycerol-3-phosphate O-acyltransferase ABHD5-like isoform X2 n=1 Tax=Uloborus diversus TaxID=327109 RepID=UPI002409B845|nr:1-acylglycerol-3-phosphate O-acyltransferase ABHD5-like isoform X2 [Uloborus diversus]
MSWIRDWFRWCPTSDELIEQAEKKLLSYVKSSYELDFVTVTHTNKNKEEECKIRSLIVHKKSEKTATPLVLLHGFASGSALWVLNIDSLSQNRPLYTLDLLGFGRSSRPVFSSDPEIAESQFVDSIEQWRKKVHLDNFILLGHSMGGFIAASYAIKYPDKVKHLILADPWGFPEPDMTVRRIEIPLWVKVIAAMIRPFNPLAGLRVAGPLGPQLIQRLRPDLMGKFQPLIEDISDVSNYIYHCNAQTPSGETAFKAMNAHYGWAKRPMISRIFQLRHDIPITFIYGSRSWIDSNSGLQSAELRRTSCVKVKLIQGAGHHVYADKVHEFNKLVSTICKDADDECSDVKSLKEESPKSCMQEAALTENNSDSPSYDKSEVSVA